MAKASCRHHEDPYEVYRPWAELVARAVEENADLLVGMARLRELGLLGDLIADEAMTLRIVHQIAVSWLVIEEVMVNAGLDPDVVFDEVLDWELEDHARAALFPTPI